MSSSSDDLDVKSQTKSQTGDLPVPVLASEEHVSGKRRVFGAPGQSTVRGMHSRHLTFIAIGGTLGTGIFLSAGSSVATAGAGGALIAYCVVGFFVYGVVLTLGEMSSLIPVSGAFATFGDRFVSPVLGATLGVNYVIQWAFSIPSELTAASIILNYWTTSLQTYQWAIIIIVPVFIVQLINVRAYGEAEYWLSMIKVILIVMFTIVGLIYNWGGVIGHPGPGLKYFNDGPFFGGFTGFVETFTYAFFSYGGVELVALAAGESQNPVKSVPRAIRATFIRILLFYVMVVFVIGLNIDHNDPSLFEAYDNSDVAASPITTVFRLAGFGAAVHIVNAVLLTAVLSATNSCFFASSRMLMSLAQAGRAPKVFGWVTKRGVPVPALLVVLAISCLTFLTTIWGDGVAFTWFLNVTGISALLTWISIAIINVRFRQAFRAQGRSLDDLPFKAPFSPYLALSAITLGLLMMAAEGWAATTYDDGKLAQDVVAVYIGMALFLVVGIGYFIHHKITKPGVPIFVPLLECDFDTGATWHEGDGARARALEAEDEKAALAEGRRGWVLWQKVQKYSF